MNRNKHTELHSLGAKRICGRALGSAYPNDTPQTTICVAGIARCCG
jgi:hypothetical protein